MNEIFKLHVSQNAHEAISNFLPFVPDALHSLLLKSACSQPTVPIVIAFGATSNNYPIGVVIASYTKYPSLEVIVNHIFVHPDHRKQGVGLKLFTAMIQEAHALGGRLFFCLYPKDHLASEFSSSIALEKIFIKSGWKAPRLFLIKCCGNIHSMHIPILVGQLSSTAFASDVQEFLWKDLKVEERKTLLFQEKTHVFNQFVSPFNNETIIEYSNSLGIRYHGSVAGWMLTHLIKPDTIRYSSLFLHHTLYHRKSIMIKLIADAVALQKQSTIPLAELEIPVVNVPKSWVNLIERHFVPYVDKVIRFYQAWCQY